MLLARAVEGGPPELAGRPHEAVGNGSPRWMVADRAAARRTETEPGLQAGSSLSRLPPAAWRPRDLGRRVCRSARRRSRWTVHVRVCDRPAPALERGRRSDCGGDGAYGSRQPARLVTCGRLSQKQGRSWSPCNLQCGSARTTSHSPGLRVPRQEHAVELMVRSRGPVRGCHVRRSCSPPPLVRVGRQAVSRCRTAEMATGIQGALDALQRVIGGDACDLLPADP
jgi:hypothetical protein